MLVFFSLYIGFSTRLNTIPVDNLFNDLLDDLGARWPILQLNDLQAHRFDLCLKLLDPEPEFFNCHDVLLGNSSQLNDLLIKLNLLQLVRLQLRGHLGQGILETLDDGLVFMLLVGVFLAPLLELGP